jgi:molecular chaperone GrpE
MSGKHHETHETTHKHEDRSESAASEPRADAVEGASEPSSGADDPTAKIAALEAEVAALREELSATNDKYLRKLADDVNFRKRMAREKEEGQRFAVATLLGDIIPVLDDFDRAIASAEIAKEYAVLHDGVVLIRRQLAQVLETKYGLSRLESLGKPFDPNRHEAVAVTQAGPDEGGEAVVAEEFLPGYALHDRVLRTAKVRVRMPAPRQNETSEAESPGAAESHANSAETGPSGAGS